MELLLIAGHPLFHKALCRILWELAEGLHVHEAATVVETLDILDGSVVMDLVLYDWRLPDGGRSTRSGGHLPAVAVDAGGLRQ